MTVPALAHRVSLPAAARADIAWWVEFLPSWTGRAFFPPPPVAAAALGFATDASGVGLGAAFGRIWLTRRGPPPSALIMSLSWSCCRGGRRPLLGRGMSCHTDSPAHGQHAGGAGFDAGHVYVPPSVACAPVFLFSLPSGTCICIWRTCRAAGILTLICFLGRRWRGSGPEHAGHCPCRRWFRLTFGSGFNTSPAGELRGCQHVTGLRVRAESVPDFLSGGGDPSPVPLQEFVLDLFVALRGTRLSVATLRAYVAGLQHFSFRFGFPTKVAGMHSRGLCCAASNAPRLTASRGRLGDLSVPP